MLEERVVAPIAVLLAEDPGLVDREIDVVVAPGDPDQSAAWTSIRDGALVLELRDDDA